MDQMEARLRQLYLEIFGVNEKMFDEVWHLDGFRPLKVLKYLWQRTGPCGVCQEKALVYGAFGHFKHKGDPVGKARRITVPSSHGTAVSTTSVGALICEAPEYLRCPEGHVSARTLTFSGGDDPGDYVIVKEAG
jgi:hypothetical protein